MCMALGCMQNYYIMIIITSFKGNLQVPKYIYLMSRFDIERIYTFICNI